MMGTVIRRALTNQPSGYSGRLRPTRHYCKFHNYTYYPEAWTDKKTGVSYNAGYYDENGAYYSDLAFRRDGKFDNVIAKCDYCGNTVKLDWKDGDELKCKSCGAPMRMETALDEYTQDPTYTNSMQNASGTNRQAVGCLTSFGVFFAMIFGAGICSAGMDILSDYEYSKYINSNPGTGTSVSSPSNTSLFGTTLYLDDIGNNTYKVVDKDADWEKKLKWDYGADSYYDPDTDCYVWYNTDVAPNLWQYWYDDIAGSNEYGWMEYENPDWYIEVSEGEWEKYSDSDLPDYMWHIENDFDENGADTSSSTPSNTSIFGKTLYLDDIGNNTYRVVDKDTEWEKSLSWDSESQSYYDISTACYVWYNTDVTPNLWQYWYDGIAGSDEYGWMEYENPDWYIEVSDGKWEKCPDSRLLDYMWHIENDFDAKH